MRLMTCALIFFAASLAAFAAPPATSSKAASRLVAFQPGIHIDFAHRQVEIDGRVVLREGELELFACSGRAKAHESIVSVTARPQHIFEALGLIGCEPGHPSSYHEATQTVSPATGDAVDVLVRWDDRGRTRIDPAYEWMENVATGKPLAPVYWVFAGSVKDEDGKLAAEHDGVIVPTVDFPSGILSIVSPTAATQPAAKLSATPPHAASAPAGGEGFHADQPGDLQLVPRADRIPPIGTAVTLILRPHVSAASASVRRGK